MTVFPFTAAQAKPHTPRRGQVSGSEFLHTLEGTVWRFLLPPWRCPLAPAPPLTSDLPDPTGFPHWWLRAVGSWPSTQHLWCPDRRSLPIMQIFLSCLPESIQEARGLSGGLGTGPKTEEVRRTLRGACVPRGQTQRPGALAPVPWTFSPLSHSPYKNEAAAIFI